MKITGIASVLLTLIIFSVASCKKHTGTNITASSAHGSTASHNMGGVCLSCHVQGGSGTGWWTIAGTVYTQDLSATSPNGTIYFWSRPNGTGKVVASLEVDASGNFYTSSTILAFDSIFPQIKGTSGNVQNMPQLCISGNCNSCHGIGNDKIWIN